MVRPENPPGACLRLVWVPARQESFGGLTGNGLFATIGLKSTAEGRFLVHAG